MVVSCVAHDVWYKSVLWCTISHSRPHVFVQGWTYPPSLLEFFLNQILDNGKRQKMQNFWLYWYIRQGWSNFGFFPTWQKKRMKMLSVGFPLGCLYVVTMCTCNHLWSIITNSQPSVVAHPRELMVGYSMGCGVGAGIGVFILHIHSQIWLSEQSECYWLPVHL